MKMLKLTLGALMCMCLFGCSNQETKKEETHNVPKTEEKKVAEEKKSNEQEKTDTEPKKEERKEENSKVEESKKVSSNSNEKEISTKKYREQEKIKEENDFYYSGIKVGESVNITADFWNCGNSSQCETYYDWNEFQKHREETGHDKIYGIGWGGAFIPPKSWQDDLNEK